MVTNISAGKRRWLRVFHCLRFIRTVRIACQTKKPSCFSPNCLSHSAFVQSNGYCTFCNKTRRTKKQPDVSNAVKRWRRFKLLWRSVYAFRNQKPRSNSIPANGSITIMPFSPSGTAGARQGKKLSKVDFLLRHSAICPINTMGTHHDQICSVPGCAAIRRLSLHAQDHLYGQEDCMPCTTIYRILLMHAKRCKNLNCKVPRCAAIKDFLKRKATAAGTNEEQNSKSFDKGDLKLVWVQHPCVKWPAILVPFEIYNQIVIHPQPSQDSVIVFLLGDAKYQWVSRSMVLRWDSVSLSLLHALPPHLQYHCFHSVCDDVRKATGQLTSCVFTQLALPFVSASFGGGMANSSNYSDGGLHSLACISSSLASNANASREKRRRIDHDEDFLLV